MRCIMQGENYRLRPEHEFPTAPLASRYTERAAAPWKTLRLWSTTLKLVRCVQTTGATSQEKWLAHKLVGDEHGDHKHCRHHEYRANLNTHILEECLHHDFLSIQQ